VAINPTQKQRDLLYRISTNPVRTIPGIGFTIWGQKTLQKKPSAFDRINVRRLFLVLEKATLQIMRFFVFEPNTTFTRTRVVNTLNPIFEVPKNNEGVQDFLIVCDERNNTPATIDNNELIVDIYIKPVRTAEFILVNFIATRTDQDFNELI
ncbi:MAG: phage tail sheath C-terminal domain-containing protein, partial [Candidatus Kariarchaeaceae archaeon]